MRVAVLNDIHGNLDALNAVLDEVRRSGADHIVVGGDVLVGPMSREALERLTTIDLPVDFIYGNCEIDVLTQLSGREPARVPEIYRPAIRWTAEQLSPDQRQLVASWPMTLRLDIDGVGRTLFCHGTPRDENECFTARTAEALLRPLVDPLDVALLVCGHTHMQFDRLIGPTRIVNAGSVGMPFGEPGADWLLIDRTPQLRHTPYDREKAAARFRATSYPRAEEFADKYVLNPPPAAQMLEVYSRAELKSTARFATETQR